MEGFYSGWCVILYVCVLYCFSLVFHTGCRMKQEKKQSPTCGQMSWPDFCGQIPPLGRCAPGADSLFSWFAACILGWLSSRSELVSHLLSDSSAGSFLALSSLVCFNRFNLSNCILTQFLCIFCDQLHLHLLAHRPPKGTKWGQQC